MSSDPLERLDERIRRAIGDAAGELADRGAARWAGRRVGPYRIERRIAAGGMGVVFLARRADEQFERQVAIKIVSSPLASDEARRRFRAERQILADLSHPNIAQLLDGGTTDEDVPYLVMEYIDGLPIDEYCRQRELPLAARLRLFLQVCAAVQYAHQHLIVHRDLKPSNILVTPDGAPKLLDFGIAKLLEAPTNLTVADARLLTPRNASPEQIRGQPITTASDIYSLGVLLYELTAGHPPYGVGEVTAGELERAICEEDPDLPSDGAPPALRRQLAGDLDNIVLMAMRKEPARRYATARQLAEDIERHLEHRPVAARPDTWAYRTRKFLQRHAWGAAATAGVVVLIAALVSFYTLRLANERDALARARATSDAISGFLVGLFEDANPNLTRPDVTAREVLEEGAGQIERLRETQPLVASSLMISMARAYSGLGAYDRSEALVADALAVRRRLLPADDPRIAEAMHYLGVAQGELREHDTALTTLNDALRMRETAFGAHALPVGETLLRIAFVQHRRGDYPAMGAALQRALPIHEAALGKDDAQTAEVVRQLGLYHYLVNDHAAALNELQRALAIGERIHGPDNIRVVSTLHTLARLKWQLGEFPEAIELYSRCLAIREAHLGPEHPDIGLSLYGLAVSHRDLGALDDSRRYYQRLIALQERVLGPEDFYLAMSLSGYGFLLLDVGELERAKASLTRSLAIAEKKWGASHPDLRAPLAALAKVAVEQRDFATADKHLVRALAIVEAQFPPEHVDVLRTLSTIATMNRRRGEHALARGQFEEVLARFARSVGLEHPFASEALFGMGESLKAQGELEQAETFYLAALRNYQGPYSGRKGVVAECLEGYADLLRRRGRAAEAEPVEARAAAIRAYVRSERAKFTEPADKKRA